MSGYVDSDGGGTPEGKACLEDANDAWALEEGSIGEDGMVGFPRTPPAAKTAGGIACMSCSRWCMRSSSVVVRLEVQRSAS